MAIPQDRYYQLVLLWPTNPSKFARYVELLGPIVEPYGAGLERRFVPNRVYARGLEQPEFVNLVYYADRDAFQSFVRDERFQRIVSLRTESARLSSVEGMCVRGDFAEGDSSQRLYLIELARFGTGGAEAYRAYEAEAESVMAPYGYHVERVVHPDSASGLPFQPDLLKVAYFETSEGMDKTHQDPKHERIENELYSAAVSESIWLIARASFG